ncbi:hypothetical protein ACNCSK_004531 [Escherichia coli]|uniref:hypothetical protein n=1 Tax=Enterobacteriaceae TaxID=543 RepID=UPI001102C95B|nr:MULTISPECIES: hypothetical protein [Enterobacteriaceae]EDC6115496.1 hypothetical protein [Salmonella enterica subsp. enterica serovar Java]EFX7813874.1 hypothetical protein [Shigella sonnei]EGN9433449.1 hypothetical protein [Salmonella enterica]EIX8546766.1 hypothetical protein [Salmonella enterica]EJN0250026.1 hypothetical protein [Salmonella enterica]
MENTTMDNSTFWNKKTFIYAVLQFFFYMAIFCYGYYLTYSNLSDKGFRVALLLAAFTAIVTSLQPALAEDAVSEKFVILFSLLAPLVLFTMGYLAYSYYQWSFPVSKGVVINFCWVYCIAAPVAAWGTREIID